ncbi:hypothetical protein BTR14_00885 [Rhizobium rhizosphaerae]|uniref:Peptidase M15A C-terminal domain-containing protein n=1 Tax=Xaviernesmea rhizosphaerae TaxID=1672749 RepID=A0ABX3PJ42_9HYPH|nr:D-Ala-D-Ala carboxypeptidase family metallohydrolase [Xaviernesmea rhizosphaerae]OQP88067.1 hypothetical protein BTR14_00885 [Xaviernesmea rhizosphaerae]
MIRHSPRTRSRLIFGLLASACLLSGCMTSKDSADKAADALYEAAQEEAAAKGPAKGAASAQAADAIVQPALAHPQAASAQPAVLAPQPATAATTTTAAETPAPLNSPDGSGVVMQGTAVNAMAGSIFSSRQPGQGGAPRSLFEAPASPAAYPQTASPVAPAPAEPQAAMPESSIAPAPEAARPGDSLIGLFAKSAKPGVAKAGAKAVVPQAGATPQQVAALSYHPLPGIRARSMFATVDDTDPEHDDNSPRITQASLPGLARLAARGFWLEQPQVDSSCFRPDLKAILKSVETRFGRKVLVTSGHRTPVHNARVGGAPKSRHLTCEAADIQVAGVDKLQLAGYLRSLPNVGGVGTYCHTQSVHVDTGKRRDWNWGCAPRNV